MHIVTISAARANIFNIVQTAIETHEPVIMTSKHGNAVLLSEDDFRSIQETLYLQAIPGLVEDVKAGIAEAKTDLASRDDLPW